MKTRKEIRAEIRRIEELQIKGERNITDDDLSRKQTLNWVLDKWKHKNQRFGVPKSKALLGL